MIVPETPCTCQAKKRQKLREKTADYDTTAYDKAQDLRFQADACRLVGDKDEVTKSL